MIDILLAQSYFLRFDPKLWRAMEPYPPLGTLYAAAYLRRRGCRVALFDAMLAGSDQEFAAALDLHMPRITILYEDNFNYLSKMCLLSMREAAYRMIDMARRRNIKIIASGSDAADHAAEYIDAGADIVIVGEGEATLAEVIDRLDVDGPHPRLDDIPGLVASPRFTGTGSRLHTRPRTAFRNLDELPAPAWDLVDVEQYRLIWQQRHGHFSMNMATTRGCPYHCNWCAKPIWGQAYHTHSPRRVAEELAQLRKLYEPDHIWFCDDIFGLKRGWLAEYADACAELDVLTPFKCLSRADLLLRAGEVEALARAGCEIVWIGAESGSQKILDAMDKGIKVEQVHEVTRKLRRAGVKVGFFLQFGYPGETWEDIGLTRSMVKTCRPDEIGMSVSYPLPGTRFYALVERQLGSKRNWVDSDDLAMMYRGPYGTEFYRQLHRMVGKEFRAQQGREVLGRAVRHLPVMRKHHLRRGLAAAFHYATLPWVHARLRYLKAVTHQVLPVIDSGMSHRDAAQPSLPAEEPGR